MRVSRSARFFSVLLVCGAFSCASKDDGTGVLVVPYELGNHRDCKSLDVVSVRAELDDGAKSQEVDCDATQLRFNSLKPGGYDVTVYGVNQAGVAVMDSLAAGPKHVDVIGGNTTVVVDPAIELTSAPAKLRVRWDLGFGSCESNAIANFQVEAWRADGSDLLMSAAVPCSMQGSGREQYRTVPDAMRELSGDELGEVEVQAVDAHGIVLGKPVTFSFQQPGPGGEVKLSLNCSDGGCSGSGTPDP